MVSLLFDKEGNKIPFSKWKKEALKISTHQNKHWLKTEYKTAIKRADMGSKFKKFEETKHLYPNLEWTPSRAKTPDENHKKFWGMVLPLDDVFWNTNFPGDRWGCACNVKQTKKPIKRYVDDGSSNESPKGLEGNPAITGAIFSDNHAFRKGVNVTDIERLDKFDKQQTNARVKVWYQKNIPETGKIIKNKFVQTGVVKITRGNSRSMLRKSTDSFLKTYQTILEVDIKNWKYIGYSLVESSTNKHVNVNFFTYYKTKYGNETIYVIVKVIKGVEYPYTIMKKINIDKITKKNLPK